MTPLYTEGTFDGKEVSREGDAPIEFMYREGKDSHDFAGQDRTGRRSARASTTPTRWASAPTWSAARSTTLADLISPDSREDGDPEHPDQRHHGRHDGPRVRPVC